MDRRHQQGRYTWIRHPTGTGTTGGRGKRGTICRNWAPTQQTTRAVRWGSKKKGPDLLCRRFKLGSKDALALAEGRFGSSHATTQVKRRLSRLPPGLFFYSPELGQGRFFCLGHHLTRDLLVVCPGRCSSLSLSPFSNESRRERGALTSGGSTSLVFSIETTNKKVLTKTLANESAIARVGTWLKGHRLVDAFIFLLLFVASLS